MLHPDRFSIWLESARPATLPLALASILIGSALAAWLDGFNWEIAVLCLLTALFLQILSNLANDYGDMLKGGDRQRAGPLRGMHKGLVRPAQMRQAIFICVLACVLSGSLLIAQACRKPGDIAGFLALGMLSIIAAITYTIGRRCYGYLGLGEVSVLIFFGWTGVIGSCYLQTGHLTASLLLPATAYGLLAATVLNINNIRDIESDRLNGKNTLAVRLGPLHARYYHLLLLTGAMLCLTVFAAFCLRSWAGWLFILALPLYVAQAFRVLRRRSPGAISPLLKETVLTILLTSVLFCIGIISSTQ